MQVFILCILCKLGPSQFSKCHMDVIITNPKDSVTVLWDVKFGWGYFSNKESCLSVRNFTCSRRISPTAVIVCGVCVCDVVP